MKKGRMLKSLSIMVLALGIFAGGGTFSSAATYTAYVLKPLGTNNYTYFHTKTSKTNFMDNKVTALTNTTAANFWAQYDGLLTIENISPKYKQKVSSSYTRINFLRSVNAGQDVRLAMENANLSVSNAFVSGDVRFY